MNSSTEILDLTRPLWIYPFPTPLYSLLICYSCRWYGPLYFIILLLFLMYIAIIVKLRKQVRMCTIPPGNLLSFDLPILLHVCSISYNLYTHLFQTKMISYALIHIKTKPLLYCLYNRNASMMRWRKYGVMAFLTFRNANKHSLLALAWCQ